MSRVESDFKKISGPQMAEEAMAEEMAEETKLKTHTRVQSGYIKI
jgi:hypothetical protein